MNDFIYVPQLFAVLRDSYRHEAGEIRSRTAAATQTVSPAPGLGDRFAAAWHAFFAHDGVVAARGGQGA